MNSTAVCENCGEIHELEDEYEFGAHDEYEEVYKCTMGKKEARATQPTGYKGEFKKWKGKWLTGPIQKGLKMLIGNDWANNPKLKEYLDKMETGTWDEVKTAFREFEQMILNTSTDNDDQLKTAKQDVKKAITKGYTIASNNSKCRGKTGKELTYCKDKTICDCAEDVVSHYKRKVKGASDKDKPKQEKKLKTAEKDRDKKCSRNGFTSEPIPDYIMRSLKPKKSVHPVYGKLRY